MHGGVYLIKKTMHGGVYLEFCIQRPRYEDYKFKARLKYTVKSCLEK